MDFYRSLHQGGSIGWARRLVYTLLADRLCVACVNEETAELCGVGFYYFNRRDIDEGTVHEGFSGVKESFRGKGLGTLLRKTAIEHFGRSGIMGVSSRVSADNQPSLRSNLKLGFKIVEVYYDKGLEKERYYLVKRFDERTN
ncbi:GNAT family N-acetyltransferase [Thioalkalivibrio paradoxus]|uniref:GNAT family N-acetyltransferase n=1 Tax=Thioalkalivibrio paradoxus TaxID=108010 RepID=UPI00022C4504